MTTVMAGVVASGGLAVAQLASGARGPAAAVSANAAATAISFRYRAPGECPSSSDFAALVGEQTGGGWRLAEGTPGQDVELSVDIDEATDGLGNVGRLQRVFKGAPSGTEPRRIVARNCRDVVRALALTAALMLEREKAEAPVVAIATAPVPRPPTEALLGVGGAAAALVPPSPTWGGELFLERGYHVWPSSGLLQIPELRLAVRHIRNDFPFQAGRAAVDLTAATMTACPIGAGVVRACAGLEAGALHGAGREIDVPRSTTFLWMAAGAEVRARVPLGRIMFLEAAASAMVPFRRTHFLFDTPTNPREPVGTVPSVVIGGGISWGLSIR